MTTFSNSGTCKMQSLFVCIISRTKSQLRNALGTAFVKGRRFFVKVHESIAHSLGYLQQGERSAPNQGLIVSGSTTATVASLSAVRSMSSCSMAWESRGTSGLGS